MPGAPSPKLPPDDAVPPDTWPRDPIDAITGCRLIAGAGASNQDPRYRLVYFIEQESVRCTHTLHPAPLLHRATTDEDRAHGVTTSTTPNGPQIQVQQLARASHTINRDLFGEEYKPSGAASNRPNMFQRQDPHNPSVSCIGVYATTGEPAFVTPQRAGTQRGEHDQRRHNYMGDNLRGTEFRIGTYSLCGSHVIVFTDLMVPGNMTALKRAIDERNLNFLVGEHFDGEEPIQQSVTRARDDLRLRGVLPRALTRRLPVARARTMGLPDGTLFRHTMVDPQAPQGHGNHDLSVALPIKVNFTHNGEAGSQLYVHRVPLLSNMEFAPGVYQYIDNVARGHPRDVIHRDVALQLLVVWSDLIGVDFYGPDPFRSEETRRTEARIPRVPACHVVLLSPHFYRWHEVNRLGSFVHLFTWVRMVMASDLKASEDHFSVDANAFDDEQLLRDLSLTNNVVPTISAAHRITLYPSQVPGSQLPQTSDTPRLSEKAYALIGMGPVYMMGLPTYAPPPDHVLRIAYPVWDRKSFFYAGVVNGVEDPCPPTFFTATDPTQPMAVYGRVAIPPRRWHLPIRDWTADWPLVPAFDPRAGPNTGFNIFDVLTPAQADVFRRDLQVMLDHHLAAGNTNVRLYPGDRGLPVAEHGPQIDQVAFITARHAFAMAREVRDLQAFPEIPGVLVGQRRRIADLTPPNADVAAPAPPTPHRANNEQIENLLEGLRQVSPKCHCAWTQLVEELGPLVDSPQDAAGRHFGHIMSAIVNADHEVISDRATLDHMSQSLISRPQDMVSFRGPGPEHRLVEIQNRNWPEYIMGSVLRTLGTVVGPQNMDAAARHQAVTNVEGTIDQRWEEGVSEVLHEINTQLAAVPPIHFQLLAEVFAAEDEALPSGLTIGLKTKLTTIGTRISLLRDMTEPWKFPVAAQGALSAFMRLGQEDGSELASQIWTLMSPETRQALGLEAVVIELD